MPASTTRAARRRPTGRLELKTTGASPGADSLQIFRTVAHSQPKLRPIGFQRVSLEPGDTWHGIVLADPRPPADFDEAGRKWRLDGGTHHIEVGASYADLKLADDAKLAVRTIVPQPIFIRVKL